MDDIMKIGKLLEDTGLLIKGDGEKIKNGVKEQKGGFASILLGRLGASLLWNLLIGKGMKAKIPGIGVMRAVEEAIRTGQDFNAALSSNEFWNTKVLSKWT